MDNSLVLFCLLFVHFEYTIFPPLGFCSLLFLLFPSHDNMMPMSPGASISLCPVGVFFDTLICISSCFIVFGLMFIIPVLLTLPSLLEITFGFTCFPLIVIVSS